MTWRTPVARLGVALLLSLTLADTAGANSCSRTMGPYNTYNAADHDAHRARRAGYRTSGVWGQGGIVSAWSNRSYFFNLFFPC